MAAYPQVQVHSGWPQPSLIGQAREPVYLEKFQFCHFFFSKRRTKFNQNQADRRGFVGCCCCSFNPKAVAVHYFVVFWKVWAAITPARSNFTLCLEVSSSSSGQLTRRNNFGSRKLCRNIDVHGYVAGSTPAAGSSTRDLVNRKFSGRKTSKFMLDLSRTDRRRKGGKSNVKLTEVSGFRFKAGEVLALKDCVSDGLDRGG